MDTRTLARQCGCQHYFTANIPSEIAEAYASWNDAGEFVMFLTGAGFPRKPLRRLLLSAVEGTPLEPIVKAEFDAFRTDVYTANGYRKAAKLLGDEPLMDMLRSRYTLDKIERVLRLCS